MTEIERKKAAKAFADIGKTRDMAFGASLTLSLPVLRNS